MNPSGSSNTTVTSVQMREALQRYIDAINARDTEAVVALYADDATIEDPVGTPRSPAARR